MKRIINKKFILLLVAVLMTSVLTGCYGDEIEIYSAMKKMQEIESAQSTIEMDFDFSGEGFAEEEQMMIDQVAGVLDTFKIKMDMTQTQNEDQTQAKAIVDTNIQAMGTNMNMKQWVDVNMSDDNPKMEQIIKMPKELMGTMLPEGLDKEYIYYDMMDQEAIGTDLSGLVEFTEEFQPKLMEFMEEFYLELDSDIDFINKVGKRVVDGENLNIYEMKLNDEQFKEIVRYSVNHTLENEATMDFLKEYMDVVMSITAIPEEEKAEMESEIQDGLDQLEAGIPGFKDTFNKFMDEYEDIKVLGKEGIFIEIGINNKGYIVLEKGKMDFRIDISEVTEAMGVEKVSGIVNLGINYSTKNYNINDKSIKVEMPKITAENSIDYMDLMEEQQRQMEEQLKQFEEMQEAQEANDGISIIINGEFQQVDNFIEEGTTYIPLRAMSEMFDKDVDWDSETRTVIITDQGEKLELGEIERKKQGVTIVINGEVQQVKNFIKEGTTYVPLRAMSEMFDKEVEWDSESRTAIIFDN